MLVILLVILLLLTVGGLPLWPHEGFGYGYYPSGLLGLILIVLLIWLLLGYRF